MRHITIYQEYETIQTVEGKTQGARLEYSVRDQVAIYLLGSFDERGRELCNILACVICQDMNIPLSMLVTVNRPKPSVNVKRHINSRRLF
jgi:hypothetical protein